MLMYTMLLSYHPIFLRPYHFLKLVSFLGASRTKSASVCPWQLRGAIQIRKYNTIHPSTHSIINPTHPSIHTYIHPATRPSSFLSIHPLDYLSIYPSIHRSI